MVSGAGCEVVLIPHGYHPCRARNGFEMYFLKIMVGPLGKWRFIPAPEVEWIMGKFHRLAATHTVVPVWSEVVADTETPVSAYLKLVGDGVGFLLESVEHGERSHIFISIRNHHIVPNF